ncbi:protein fem-1 homolog C-like [Toxorhynchites rutilus septentrionalis]|uniref:protein fem-1 homolog C-like n=1 Tax=Toxorhynchites rutilus septentrionalis TaxID=329112 RepID=UPI002478EE80|nr:protein fem-1 homolog C-like [Toxorhynchites rutilus septentrionalis]
MSEYTEEFLSNLAKSLFNAINSSTGKLPEKIREKLQYLPVGIRRKVMQRTFDGATALSKACVVGNVEIIDYLVKVCDADIEQRSIDPRSEDCPIAPLILASKYGRLEAVKHLIQLGANVNVTSKCGSTPALIACSRKDSEMIQYLVEKGADVSKPNSRGETCFFNWIKSLPYGFENRDKKIIQLLLKYGADPFVSCGGKDALQFLCTKRKFPMVAYLMEHINYPLEKIANTIELVGAIMGLVYNNQVAAVAWWRKSFRFRMNGTNNIQKRPVIPPQSIYGNVLEFQTLAELEQIAVSRDAIVIQSLLIFERILGVHDPDTLVYMILFGHYCQQNKRMQMCVDVWMLVLLRQKDAIMGSIVLGTVQRITGFMLNLIHGRNSIVPRFGDAWTVFQMLALNAIESRQLVMTAEQQRYFDRTVHYISYLIDVLLSVAQSGGERKMVNDLVRILVHKNIRCITTGETLLHLSSKCGNFEYPLGGSGFEQMFRNGNVTKLLLECGAHIDLPDAFGIRSSDLLAKNPYNKIFLIDHVSLECLCANFIVAKGIPYRDLAQVVRDQELAVVVYEFDIEVHDLET